MSTLGTGVFDTLLRRRLSIKATPVAPEMSPELQGVLTLENDRVENRLLAGQLECIGQINAAAAAGFNSWCELGLLAESRVICTIERFIILNNTAGVLVYDAGFVFDTTAAVGGGKSVRDMRATQAGTFTRIIPAAELFSQNTAAGGAPAPATHVLRVAANTQLEVQLDAVLQQRWSFRVRNQTANSPIQVMFYWREREAEPSELLTRA